MVCWSWCSWVSVLHHHSKPVPESITRGSFHGKITPEVVNCNQHVEDPSYPLGPLIAEPLPEPLTFFPTIITQLYSKEKENKISNWWRTSQLVKKHNFSTSPHHHRKQTCLFFLLNIVFDPSQPPSLSTYSCDFSKIMVSSTYKCSLFSRYGPFLSTVISPNVNQLLPSNYIQSSNMMSPNTFLIWFSSCFVWTALSIFSHSFLHHLSGVNVKGNICPLSPCLP